MTTDKKNFDFRPDRGIIMTIKYPGVVQLVARDVWDIVVWCSSGFSQIPETLAAQCFPALLIESKWWNALFLPQFWPQWNDFFCFFWYTIFWFPGVVQLIERAVWDREARGFEPHHSDQTGIGRTPISSAAASPWNVRSDPQQKSAVLGVIPRRRFFYISAAF